MFTPKPVSKLIKDELDEALRQLLKAETAVEFAQSEVSYQTARINRLQGRLNEIDKKTEPNTTMRAV